MAYCRPCPMSRHRAGRGILVPSCMRCRPAGAPETAARLRAGMGRQAGGGAPGAHARQSVSVGKLNLVDLAGSERVHITGATGTPCGRCGRACPRLPGRHLRPAASSAWLGRMSCIPCSTGAALSSQRLPDGPAQLRVLHVQGSLCSIWMTRQWFRYGNVYPR